MLIIGFGVTEALLSTLVFTCEICGNHAAHQLTKQNRKFSLFFIPLFSVGTKYLDTVPLVAGSSRSAGSRQRQQPGRSARSCGDSAKPFTSAPGQLTNGLVDGSHDHLTGPAYVRRNPSLNGDQSRQRFPSATPAARASVRWSVSEYPVDPKLPLRSLTTVMTARALVPVPRGCMSPY